MFVHHVYFWLKNADNTEEHARLLKGIQTLKNIEVIKTIHIGVPANTNRGVIDASYAFSQLMIFDNPQDQEVYQSHPIHLKFIEDCASLWSKVIVYDSVDA
ncbi:MAG: Dabb family protein [Bacteroidota bacterium]